MNTRRTTLLIAILLAVGTGWLALSYISSLQHTNQASGAPRSVLVATQTIPARATITAAMVRQESRPASAVEPDAIADPAKATGQLSLITIPAGAEITASKIGSTENSALPVRLRPGMRAVSIAIDKVKGVSGLVQPGDRVDVIAVPPRAGNQPPDAATILRGVRVLAIGDTLEYASATPSPQEQNSTTVTLEVSPKQADLLAMADINTTLRLALRSPKEPIRSEPVEHLVFGSLPQAPTQPSVGSSDSAAFLTAMAQANRVNKVNASALRFPSSGSASDPPSSNGVQLIVGDHVYGSVDTAAGNTP